MSNRVFYSYEEDPETKRAKIHQLRKDLKELHGKNPLVLDFSKELPESREDMVVQADYPQDQDAFITALQKSLEEDPFPALIISLPDNTDHKSVNSLVDKLNILSPGEGPNIFIVHNRDLIHE